MAAVTGLYGRTHSQNRYRKFRSNILHVVNKQIRIAQFITLSLITEQKRIKIYQI